MLAVKVLAECRILFSFKLLSGCLNFRQILEFKLPVAYLQLLS